MLNSNIARPSCPSLFSRLCKCGDLRSVGLLVLGSPFNEFIHSFIAVYNDKSVAMPASQLSHCLPPAPFISTDSKVEASLIAHKHRHKQRPLLLCIAEVEFYKSKKNCSYGPYSKPEFGFETKSVLSSAHPFSFKLFFSSCSLLMPERSKV